MAKIGVMAVGSAGVEVGRGAGVAAAEEPQATARAMPSVAKTGNTSKGFN
ncbi:MAG: hypothetical protein IH873_01065 [Chloroflexi bacterium]|nr:hypothetical protein [Chloroflexota bacterium]